MDWDKTQKHNKGFKNGFINKSDEQIFRKTEDSAAKWLAENDPTLKPTKEKK